MKYLKDLILLGRNRLCKGDDMFLPRFLGIEAIPNARNLIMKFLVVILIISIIGNLSSTFFVLYAYDKIGPTQASIIISFTLLIQLLTDYPSGSLGDYIGQRWVLSIAFACYAVSYWLLSFSTTLPEFFVYAFFFGLANAQASGTLGTWLDNNYKSVVGDQDPDRKIYGFFNARIGSIVRITMAFTFTIGGFIATSYSRELVFFIQAILSGFLIFLIIFLVQDVKSNGIEFKEDTPSTEPSSENFFTFLTGGFKFLVSSKSAFFFLMGMSIIYAALNVWGSLILFPIYFGYTGTDGLASLFRTIMFFVGIPIGIYMAKVSQKFSNSKLPLFDFLITFTYYLPFVILLAIIPPVNALNLPGAILTALLLTIGVNCIYDIAETLRGRTVVDLVPSNFRNSVYSLIPTLTSIIGIPTLPIAGSLIEQYGLNAGTLVPLFLSFIGATCIYLSLYFGKKKPDRHEQNTL
ncbi:MAG: MFS transporter [Candidatus Hodarchaeota archaeon]